MEKMAVKFPITADFWKGKRVAVTGHTGFKGSWLILWLKDLGAEVMGYALDPKDKPSFFEAARLAEICTHTSGDVCDLKSLKAALTNFDPEIIFHLAAQSLVRYSYDNPLETYATNVMGTANVLESARGLKNLRVLEIITTDKVYENREWDFPYRENDPLGGRDPYSASKACAEIVTHSYISSFYEKLIADGKIGVASTRAGNVYGGGDWAKDRIIPDAARAFTSGGMLEIRNPHSIRPWQFVLEPLAGYLILARALWEKPAEFSRSFNFASALAQSVNVGELIQILAKVWGEKFKFKITPQANAPHEAKNLLLDPGLAGRMLGYQSFFTLPDGLRMTAEFYEFHSSGKSGLALRQFAGEQIEHFTRTTGVG